MKLTQFVAIHWICLAAFTASANADNASHLEDLMALPLEQLVKVEVEAASILPSSTLLAASTVDYIPRPLWQNYGARRTLDALSHLSSTVVLPTTLGSDALSIRGYTNSTSRWGTALIWDDAPLNDFFFGSGFTNASNIGLGTLQDIEVIRGPGSAMHGSDAFHGVVALDSFYSTQELTQFHADISSNDYYNANLQHMSQLNSRHSLNVAMENSGQGNQHALYQYNDPNTAELKSSERANEYDSKTISLQLRSKGTTKNSWFSRVGLYSHQYDAEGFPGIGTDSAGNNDISGANNHFNMVQLSTGKALNDRHVIELKSYAWQSDYDTLVNFSSEENTSFRKGFVDQSRYGFEGIYKGRLSSEHKTHWALALGADKIKVNDSFSNLYNSEGEWQSHTDDPTLGAKRFIRYATFEVKTSSANNLWHFIYGARHDNYSDVESHTSPRFSVIYQPAPDMAVKLLYSNAFRAPNAIELYGSIGTIQASTELKPEVLDSLELVLIKQNEQWLYRLIAFKTLWQDGIIAIPSGSQENPFRLVNQQQNESQGFSWQVNRDLQNLSLGFSGSYVSSEEHDSGRNYAMFPKWIANMELGWRFPQWNTQLYLQQRFMLEMVDVDSSSVQFNAMELPNYSRTDITAMKKINKQISLSLSIRNLFDRNNILPSINRSKEGTPDEGFSLVTGIQLDFM